MKGIPWLEIIGAWQGLAPAYTFPVCHHVLLPIPLHLPNDIETQKLEGLVCCQ